jgi:hypothetical protein
VRDRFETASGSAGLATQVGRDSFRDPGPVSPRAFGASAVKKTHAEIIPGDRLHMSIGKLARLAFGGIE